MSKIETRVVKRKLKELKPSNLNARQMSELHMERLTTNIERDGALTSVPLVYRDRIISGHHRVMAAIRAGVETADCIEILGEVDDHHLTALQLSHNSISGKDDPNVLAEMLANLPPLEQEFASVDLPALDALNLGPSIRLPPAIQVTVSFLPSEYDEIEEAAKSVSKARAAQQFEPNAVVEEFLECFFAVKNWASGQDGKKPSGVFSLPGTLTYMARLAKERLDELA